MKISVTENGPYVVDGGLPLSRQAIGVDTNGDSVAWIEGETFDVGERYELCRCGQSANKPFCDNTHLRVDFDGTETASRQPYLEQATAQRGPTFMLTDASALCAFGRFCDVAGQIWNLVEQPGPDAARLTAQEAAMCPSGRLVAWDPDSGDALEPELEPSIVLVEDPAQGCSGPLWLRGGVPVAAADGTEYERRNRVTVCRCGASANKPFCDGTHAAIGFSDAND
jgi:CDGSH-type Zn-finger protein